MKLHRNGTNWNRDERNKTNENWDEIEGNYNNVVENVSDKAFDKVVDSAKLDWGEPVASMTNLPTDDVNGKTRMVRDTGKVYRFNGTEWSEIQDIDPTAINEVDSRLTSQLAENVTNKDKYKTSIRVASYNIAESDTEYELASQIMKDNLFDLVGAQEIHQTHESNSFFRNYAVNNFQDSFFKEAVPYNIYPRGNDYGVGVLSKFSILESYGKVYDLDYDYENGVEPRAFIRSVITISGKRVSFYTTHMSFGKDGIEKDARDSEMLELFNTVQADENEYKIITGDMNTLIDDLSIFIDAGYLSAQGYEGVEYKTGHNGTGRAIDHILFTPNFKIENVGVIDSQESSDHMIIYADVTFDNDLKNLITEEEEYKKKRITETSDVHFLKQDGRVIEESGSNENGHFIKYSDGTLMCWHQIELNIVASVSYIEGRWYYPHKFTGGLVNVNATPIYETNQATNSIPTEQWGNTMIRQNTDTPHQANNEYMRIRQYRVYGSPGEWKSGHKILCNVMATGRWQ